jgi:hypothetical protein
VEQGDGTFRQALADFLAPVYEAPVDPSTLFVTNGASCALDLLCSLYTSPGDAVLVEEPTYYLALRIFEDHRLRIIAAGISWPDLESLNRFASKPIRSFTGADLPESERENTCRISAKTGRAGAEAGCPAGGRGVSLFTVLSDTTPPFALYAEQVNRSLVSSFKILAPAWADTANQ